MTVAEVARETSRLVGRFVSGEHIWERDWDVCAVLDGCRLDAYQTVRGQFVDSLWSVGSTSQTWIPRTFKQAPERVGYVTGNPFHTKIDTGRLGYFHAEAVQDICGVETVPPTALAERAIDTWRRRDDLGIDRLVVHFMQPHVPFRDAPEVFGRFRGTETWGSTVWSELGESIDRGKFLEAYLDNLQWVLSDGVGTLRENVDGTLAVTADHGNAAGECGFSGHPRGCLVPAVRRVPWETFEAVDTGSCEPSTSKRPMETRSQLEALGYR